MRIKTIDDEIKVLEELRFTVMREHYEAQCSSPQDYSTKLEALDFAIMHFEEYKERGVIYPKDAHKVTIFCE